MTMSKRKGSRLVALCAFLLLALAQSAGAQIPPGEQYTEWVRLKCPAFPDSVEAPSVVGYERLSGECLGRGLARLHYASSHVSTVDAILCKGPNGVRVVGILMYAPCQSCNPSKTTVYELKCNKSLSYFHQQNLSEYARKYGKRRTYSARSYKQIWSSYLKSVMK